MRIPYSLAFAIALTLSTFGIAQPNFPYRVQLEPISVQGLPGIHSFTHAENEGKWLLIGGRTDGMHPRQPFASFPAANNNTSIYVVDINSTEAKSVSIASLPSGIAEQLQSSNMCFHQEGDTLYLVGGYAYSATEGDHITFPKLMTVQVSGLIQAIEQGTSIQPYFKQIEDTLFAVTGGNLGKLKDEFLLVGGQRFDGRYNPMGHNTYVQHYTNQVRRFRIYNHGGQLSFGSVKANTDQAHLHRRDYNLMPYINPAGEEAYLISSGVFQIQQDLPFLYPVEVDAVGFTPITQFNQYLSHYHSAKFSLYDTASQQMHMLFLGGMSQYYYSGNQLVKDDNVPFVRTISRVSRDQQGDFYEFNLIDSMPGLHGSSAELIHNPGLKHYQNGVLKWNAASSVDSLFIGYVVGGIQSPETEKNPFSNNNTALTSSNPTVYKVWLIHEASLSTDDVLPNKMFDINLYPNPSNNQIRFSVSGIEVQSISYLLLDTRGVMIRKGVPIKDHNDYQVSELGGVSKGVYNLVITINEGQVIQRKVVLE